MTEKRFTIKHGYHGVHRLHDTVTHKTYDFIGVKRRNIDILCELLNDVIK